MLLQVVLVLVPQHDLHVLLLVQVGFILSGLSVYQGFAAQVQLQVGLIY